MRRRFLWRMGCLFGLFVLLIPLIFLVLFGLMGRWLGFVRLPHPIRMDIPAILVMLVIGLALLALATHGLRRISIPVGDLIEASNRVADGDYTTRVPEQGPEELNSLAQAFNSMASQLEVTEQQRRKMLADVTHELRTPLTVIQGNLEGMLDGIYPADEEHLKSIIEETHILSRLVDDLRTLALAESGALQLKKEPTDLAVLIGETVTALTPQANAIGVTIHTDFQGELPLISLDAERIHEVIANLITNALRYTPQGGTISIRYSMIREENGKKVVISVQDTGSGIRPEDLPHVFDRFYKSQDSGGMGLGLSIAKHIVEAHGGTITAHSPTGQGTTILLTLPVG